MEEVEAAVKLAESLTKIAPVYFSYGNHELMHLENYGYDAAERFREAGVNVMEYSWEEVDINGQNLRIGGLYSYCMPARYLYCKFC